MADIMQLCLSLKEKKDSVDKLSESLRAASKEFEAASAALQTFVKSQGLDLHSSSSWPLARLILAAVSQNIPSSALLDDSDLSGLLKKDPE